MASLPTSNNRTSLVTGISGFVGAWVGLYVLEAGYNLRGTVRRPEAIRQLLTGPYKPYVDAGRVQIETILDMTQPGAFDEAVVGVDNIQHVASPATFVDQPLSGFVDPAVGMVKEILDSAIAHAGPQLRVVTLTSSMAAVITPAENRQFTTTDWNTWAADLARQNGDATPIPQKYQASKVASEQCLWNFKAMHKPQFAIAAVHPALVFGPLLLLPETPNGFSVSVALIWKCWAGEEIPPVFGAGCYIDVRDIARMHLWTALHPADADGKRYLMAAGRGSTQAAVDLFHKNLPERSEKMKKGNPGEGYVSGTYEFVEGEKSFDNSLPLKALGHFTGFEKSVLDMVPMFQKYLQ